MVLANQKEPSSSRWNSSLQRRRIIVCVLLVLITFQAVVVLRKNDYWDERFKDQHSNNKLNIKVKQSHGNQNRRAIEFDFEPEHLNETKPFFTRNLSQPRIDRFIRNHKSGIDYNYSSTTHISNDSQDQNDRNNNQTQPLRLQTTQKDLTTAPVAYPLDNSTKQSANQVNQEVQLNTTTNNSSNVVTGDSQRKTSNETKRLHNPDLLPNVRRHGSNQSLQSFQSKNDTMILRNQPTTQVGVLQSKGVLDLLPWELQSIRNYTNISVSTQQKLLGICNTPAGIHRTCCPGSYSGGGSVSRSWSYNCWHGEAIYDRVAQTVLRELEQTNNMIQDDECDLCRIVEIINRHNLRFAITGDSMMMSQNVDGFLCELLRRGYNVVKIKHERINPYGLVGMKEIWKYQVSGPKHWLQPTNMTFLFQYRPLYNMSETQHMAASYDVLIMNFGLHYRFGKYNQGRDKEGYEDMMAKIFNITSQSNISLLAHRETSAQHHNHSGGEWGNGRTKCVSLSLNDSPIIGWRERVVQDKAKELGYNVVVADYTLPLAGKPVAGQRELVILPFFNLTASLHYFHPDECSHYCSTPYLWMPIWRSLRLAMDRQWSLRQ